MGRAYSTNGAKRKAYRILVGMPEGKRPLVGPRYGWEYNIEIAPTHIGWCGIDWIDLAQVRDQ
jgi:hypothetical protein